VKESRDASDDRCESLATALVNYARTKMASEKRLGDTLTGWAVDVTDNPDIARTLACALIGNSLSDIHVLCRLHVFLMKLCLKKVQIMFFILRIMLGFNMFPV
jgi:hypothetical protein